MFRSSANERLRTLLFTLLTVVLVLSMAACAPAAPAAAPEGATEADAGQASAPTGDATLRISWWGGQQRTELTNEIIDMFQEQNPDIEIERDARDWLPYWDKLNVETAANNQPCGMQMQSRFLQQFAANGALLPLDDLVADGSINLDGVAQSYVDSGLGDDGNLYMIPTGVFFHVIMYNASMAEAGGIPAPPDSWNWDDLAQYVIEAAPNLPEGVYPVMDMSGEAAPFVSWVTARGESFFTGSGLGFPKESLVEWLEYWEGLREAGVTYPPDVAAENVGVTIEDSLFANGKEFLVYKPANQLDAHQNILQAVTDWEEIKMVRMPIGPGGAGDDMGTNGISIGSNCSPEQIEAAVKWINFFLQDENAAKTYASDNGVVTVERFQNAQMEDPDTAPGQREQIRLLQIVDDDSIPTYYPNGYRPMIDALGRASQSVAFGELTPEEATDAFFEEADDIFGAN